MCTEHQSASDTWLSTSYSCSRVCLWLVAENWKNTVHQYSSPIEQSLTDLVKHLYFSSYSHVYSSKDPYFLSEISVTLTYHNSTLNMELEDAAIS